MAQAEIGSRSLKSSRRTRVAAAPRAPIFNQLPRGVAVNAGVKASMEEIERLGPARAAAFMNGIASIISATNQIRERP
jgi:hypothetical protein